MDFTRALTFARDHRVALAAGGGVLALGGVVSWVQRRRAAKVGQRVVDKIRMVLGAPYVWGGRDPSTGFDCSGVIVWAFRELGLQPKKYNATAAALWQQSSRVFVPQVGDLVFYGGGIFSGPTHVMVATGGGRVIGATGGGPSTTTAAKARAIGAAVKELPIDYRRDRYGIGRLPVEDVKSEEIGALNMLGAL